MLRIKLYWVPLVSRELFLLKYTTNTIITSITHNASFKTLIKNLQNRCCTQTCFQSIKSFLARLRPLKFHVLPSQLGQRTGDLRKSHNKTTIVVSKSKKLLHLVDSLRYWPITHSLDFTLFYRDTLSTHNMSKKVDLLKKQMALAVFQIQLVLCQNLKYTIKHKFMLFNSLTVNQYIIQVNHNTLI